MTTLDALRTDDYAVTDQWFGAPYVDIDEWRTTIDQAYQYRYVHGGFLGCDTRFSCYFPPEEQWQGRLLFPVEGGLGGYEDTCETIQGFILDQLGIGFRLGAYVVESNSGHVGVALDERAGEDPSIYGYRAHVESARFSKHLAEQVYGRPPTSSFAYGGGGGGMRAQLCLENSDVFDAAMPYVGVAATMDSTAFETPESERFLRTATATMFGCVLNVHRLLGEQLARVIEAVEPGGSGDPFAGLDTHQREELATLYRLGFPRGSEVLISEPVGAVSAWAWLADSMLAEDPAYFQDFWSQPGYVGHDEAAQLAGAVIRTKAVVRRVVTAADLLVLAEGLPGVGALAKFMVGMKGPDYPCAVEVDDEVLGYLNGASVTIASGSATGRSLYVAGVARGVLYLDGAGDAGTRRLADVVPGDELLIDNHDFLAFCYSHRHHAPLGSPTRLDDLPLYPQHPLPRSAALLGGPASGQFSGKLLLLPATHDSNVWPGTAVALLDRIADVQGSAAVDHVRIRWMEHAENLPGSFIPSGATPAMTTRFIDYNPLVEQSLHDLAAWVEHDMAPASTRFDYRQGRLTLPTSAAERGGVQAVLTASVNGTASADVLVGDVVTLEVHVDTPPAAGEVVSVTWDLEGAGTFEHTQPLPETAVTRLTLATKHRYAHPGTYYPTARVTTHRDGDRTAKHRLIPNLVRARVVVR